MADNVTLNAMTGGAVVRSKDRGTSETQIVALDLNPSGSETLMAGAMPVTGTFWQATQPVSIATLPALVAGSATIGGVKLIDTAGTNVAVVSAGGALKVDASATTQPISASTLPLPTGASTEATLSSLNGKVTACNTGAVTISAALPAGTALLGRASASPETSTLYNGTTALTPKFAVISASSSGVSTVVAAVASKKIRVLSYRFQSDADVSVKFRDNTAPADLTGAMATGAKGGGGGAAFSPIGHFETAAGNALSINLSGAVQVSGHLVYVEV